MHSEPPGFSRCLRLYSLLIPAPLQTSFSGGSARRYLVPADRFHHLPPDEIPVEATQRQSGPHPARPDVPHVPDNRQPCEEDDGWDEDHHSGLTVVGQHDG
ncbi:hypothetical protein PIB30_018480 [Stylosanthes scabra]|uniref:Secreted protein n=1 Tax=Stylosanthes scabra TaxID=79078 RepID=A0ABU6W5Z7_9FABA|nr:hypothetical protein [Stylosanthes scabra]